MHIIRRFTIVTVISLALVPLSTIALIASVASRERAQEALQSVIDDAAAQYRLRAGLGATERRSQQQVTDGQQELLALGRKKRELRLRLAELKNLLGLQTGQADRLLQEQKTAQETALRERERFAAFVRDVRRREESRIAGLSVSRILLRRLFTESLGDGVETDMRDTALAQTRKEVMLRLFQSQDVARVSELQMRAAIGDLAEDLASLRKELDAAQAQYLAKERSIESAQRTVTLSAEQLGEIKTTVADVHDQVLRLQGELARIDARIRLRAERSLIEKGLLSGRTNQHSQGEVSGVAQFVWPVKGRIAAGFRDESYHAFFGVPHEGIDIVAGQGTPVGSADDGVVFLVRDGGATGYTYVLIGHQGGYATLYGHLSAVSVHAGQDVARGAVIGLSGGQPGTPGAGLMTTGQHLHFEVIKAGANIDPRSVLP